MGDVSIRICTCQWNNDTPSYYCYCRGEKSSIFVRGALNLLSFTSKSELREWLYPKTKVG